tara:strand:+ start:4165 stop:4581 length:417 start_codon:yes stop_codon:yes gene_type:complete
MKRYFSRLDETKLLHMVVRKEEIRGRKDLIPSDNFLQCASIQEPAGTSFRPHRHLEHNRTYEAKIAQESWVVIEGRVKCFFYDLDNTLIAVDILHPGDASFTLYGGHTYEILASNTLVYEYKSGPYEGQENDKEFFND